MKVRIIVGAERAYAAISDTCYSMDVQLHGARSAQKSLRESAAELRQKAADSLRRAERMCEAADFLDAQKVQL